MNLSQPPNTTKQRSPVSGAAVLVAVTRATDIVLQHPDVGGRRGARARQLVVTGFPYDVVYMVHDDVVSVLAVAHHHRRPGYWRERLNG